MPHIQRSALVPFSAERMFSLVGDIERYPEFLPWCAAARVHSESEAVVVAELEVSRAGISQRFTTRNALAPGRSMTLELVEGPFEWFAGEWRFTPLAEDACKVELEMDFEYAGRIARTALAPFFAKAADEQVDAFCARARELFS